MTLIILTLILWYGGLFFQTFFHHRYSAHQMFTTSRATEKVLFILSWIFQGANYLSPYVYGVMHRMHHAYADTPQDPHSPKYDGNPLKMMWNTRNFYIKIEEGSFQVDQKFTKNVPSWKAFDRVASSTISRIIWGIFYLILFSFLVTSWWQWFLLPIVLLMAPIHGMIINWFAHLYGYTNFELKDTSTNLLPFDFLMWGEAYHNNHHKNASRANFGGIRWHEIDPTYLVMRVFHFFKIIRLKT
ncbi:MAG: acyl-CoA desaturase [Flavobacteriales bacterium]|nr:acyl-CoA desaturase [Flavobacteriales bacterium]